MSVARIYQKIPLKIGEKIMLDEGGTHHLARVLRAQLNDYIVIFNGMGGEFTAKIIEINKKNTVIFIENFNAREAESPLNLYLAQGMARGEKMDFIVQKAVELGVKKIFPLITERCNVRLGEERESKKLRHWESIIISACEQSGRNFLPEIAPPQTFSDWILHANAAQKFVLSPHVSEGLNAKNLDKTTPCLLLIGPEGGLSDNEIEIAKQHDFKPIALGQRVLRTETATIVALSVFQAYAGDL